MLGFVSSVAAQDPVSPSTRDPLPATDEQTSPASTNTRERTPAKVVTGADAPPGDILAYAEPPDRLQPGMDPGAASDWSASNPLNDLVRVFAGLPVAPESSYFELTETPAWQQYHDRITATWAQHDQTQHARVAAFRDQWLSATVHRDRDLLYPFAGADFLYADLFFPTAKNIYMFGLEPLGEIPEREQLTSGYFNGVVRATEDLLRLTFFRTNAMRDDFRQNGTVPLLCYFIVHRGHTVKDIVYLRLDQAGVPLETDLPDATGARIAFRDGKSGAMRNLWYWRGDLSNQAFANALGLKRYVADLPASNLYMKAASYLCYHQAFSDACGLFRDRAVVSLQEDSGMPVRFFPKDEWNHTLFGQYRYPIAIFTDRIYRQNDELKTLFAQSDHVHELPFRLGYHASARADNLMLAIRKTALAGEPQNGTQVAHTEPEAPPLDTTVDAIAEETATAAAIEASVAGESSKRSPQEVEADTQQAAVQAPPIEDVIAVEESPPDNNLAQTLSAAGIAYQVNQRGHLSFVTQVSRERTQLVFIASETKRVGNLDWREVWSIGYLTADPSLPESVAIDLLEENATSEQGAWEAGQFLGQRAGIFKARVPADADWSTLETTFQLVSAIADRKESELIGNDNL